MATRTSFNKNNSAVKRIMQEARELANDPSTEYSAAPLEDNLFEWHCTLRGAPDTDFEGGLYHFRILLPAEYPFRPPSLMMLTPSGRFETNTKLCISFTSYHEELWQPAWGVRTAIIGLQGFFPLKGQAAMGIGSLEAPGSERRRLAKLSRDWVCPQCQVPNHECLPDPPTEMNSESSSSTGCTIGVGDPPLGRDKVEDDGRSKSVVDGIADRCASKIESAEHGSGSMKEEDRSSASLASSSGDRRPEEGSERPPCQPPQTLMRDDESSVAIPTGTYTPTSSIVSMSKGTGSGSGTTPTASVDASTSIRQGERQVEIRNTSVSETQYNPSMSTTPTPTPTPTPTSLSTVSRPPILLDAAISVLLVLVAALLARKVL